MPWYVRDNALTASAEDSWRIEDATLFEGPCKCIEDARSLVINVKGCKCLVEEL